jgi:hypothetical protein
VPFYVWWLIPLVATLAAIAVLSWRSRDRPIDPHDSVAERLRFEQAMRQPTAGGRSRASARKGESAETATGPPDERRADTSHGDEVGRGGPGA